MVEGLWLVEFRNMENSGKGVVTLETQRILGGDSGYYYIGDYSIDHNTMNATIKISQHYEGMINIFHPLTEINLDFKNQDISNGLENTILIGQLLENPDLSVSVSFKKLSDLP